MRTKLYCVKDAKSGLFSHPIHEHTDDLAIRNFVSAVGAAEGPMSQYPEDFTLFRVGEYDNELGMLFAEQPYSLMSGIEGLKKGRERSEKLEALQKEIEELRDA